jgi:hypothetical protein
VLPGRFGDGWTLLPLIAHSDGEQRQLWMRRTIETLEPVLGQRPEVGEGVGVWRAPDGNVHLDDLLVPQWHCEDVTLASAPCREALGQISENILRNAHQAAFSFLLGSVKPRAYYYLETPVIDGIEWRSKQIHPLPNKLARGLNASVTGFDQCLWFMTPSMTHREIREFMPFLARYSGATAIRPPDHDVYFVVSFASTYGAFGSSAHELVRFLRAHGIHEVYIAGQGIKLETVALVN